MDFVYLLFLLVLCAAALGLTLIADRWLARARHRAARHRSRRGPSGELV
jgi:hypothetical protein